MVNSQSIGLVVYVYDTAKGNWRKVTFVRQIGANRGSTDGLLLVLRILGLYLIVTEKCQPVEAASNRRLSMTG